MSHADTVRSMYEAFGRGDIAAILEHLSPNVEWECDRAPNDVPWLQPLRGRHEVPKFFEALAEHMDLRRFEPKVVLESGDVVLVLFEADAWSRRTGRRIPETEAAHIWHFDASGLAIRYKNAVDSLGASQALRA